MRYNIIEIFNERSAGVISPADLHFKCCLNMITDINATRPPRVRITIIKLYWLALDIDVRYHFLYHNQEERCS